MKQAIFDIETNGLLKDLTTIHCIAIQDGKQSDRRVKSLKSYRPDQIEEALEVLENADEIIGHNIIGFDIPAIQKLYPKWKPKGKVIDTLVLSRLIKADLMSDDATCAVHPDGFTRSLWGSHSLKAWGLRMGNLSKVTMTEAGLPLTKICFSIWSKTLMLLLISIGYLAKTGTFHSVVLILSMT